MNIFFSAIIILLFTACQLNAAKIIPHTDLSYFGTFSLPTSSETNKCQQWNYIKANLAYRASGDSGNGTLYITSGNGCDTIAEVSIPTLKDSTTTAVTSLNVAPVVTSWTSISGGDLTSSRESFDSTAIGIGDIEVIGVDQGVSSEQLIAITHKHYAVSTESTSMLLGVSTDLLTINKWWEISVNGIRVNTAEYQHYIFKADSTWAAANTSGRTLFTGCNRQNIGGSFGATMYAFQPGWGSSPPVNGTMFPATKLVSYGNSTQMNHYQESNNPGDFTWVKMGSKNAIVGTFIMAGRAGRLAEESETTDWTETISGWYYGNRHPAGIGGKGYHNEPYSRSLIFYDPDEIVAATPSTAQPYAVYDISDICYNPNGFIGTDIGIEMGGIAYDSINSRLFVVELIGNTGRAVVHVFGLSDTGGDIDIYPPSKPSGFAVTEQDSTHAVLEWDSVTDNTTDVRYIIYVNGYPEIITDQTSYNYTFVDEWAVGDGSADGWPAQTDITFSIRAVDKYWNISSLNSLRLSPGQARKASGTGRLQ